MEDRRFIEETFPVKEISEESAREKSIRHGHISTLHIWWARRPLSSSRATAFAALIPPARNNTEARRTRNFIIKLSKWENSLDESMLEEARKSILAANNHKPPKVLDPFAGGGAIPLEAMRLGCETYAMDYNPVAAIILKCSLEYPQKFGSRTSNSQHGLVTDKQDNELHEDVRKWGYWVLEKAQKEIGQFYPTESDGSTPVGYIWARTIRCQNPSCEAEIPLMRQYWLSKKRIKKVSLLPVVSEKKVRFKIVGTGLEKVPKGFDPEKGTISRAIVSCLVCGSVIDQNTTRSLFMKGESSERLIAVITSSEGRSGKKYREANAKDLDIFLKAEASLQDKTKELWNEWGVNPVPDEPTPEGKGSGAERAFSVRNYNINSWGDIFNSRQKLALITFTQLVRNSYEEMLDKGYNSEYAKAVVSYLAFNLDRLVSYCSSLGYWHVSGEKISPAMQRQTLSMVFDYAESNPFAESFSWSTNLDWILRVIDQCSRIPHSTQPIVPLPTATQGSAISLPYQENYFDAVFTDPPYYDNVPYSYLSDFFYVWLKRAIGAIYPDLFATPLTPKKDEIVVYSNIDGGFEAGKRFFENMLNKAFGEINRVLKPNGISVIVYAHKSTAGWETLINSLLDSRLVVTGAWPIHTEMKARLRAKESAALASSIYMIARKSERHETGFYNEVKSELKGHLRKKLDDLWNEGVSGADFFIAAIGSSIEVFGRYDKIIDDEGNVIRANRILEDIRKVVTEFAVKQVLHNGIAGEINPMTRFYILWRWAYGDSKLEFDDAHKLAQGVGIDLPQEWNKGFIRKDKEFIEILGPDGRELGQLESSNELIDVLHRCLILWKKGKPDGVTDLLRETGYGKSDVFYRVAQAISESLPNDNTEKRLLEGFLAGKERISKDVLKETGQQRLFE